MIMKLSLLIIGTIIVTLFVIFFIISSNNKGQFSLKNNASETISFASITICNQTIKLMNIQPGENVSGSYDVKSDSHYTIKIELQSGKSFLKEIGYVTNGMDFQHEILVTNSSIEIIDSKEHQPDS